VIPEKFSGKEIILKKYAFILSEVLKKFFLRYTYKSDVKYPLQSM